MAADTAINSHDPLATWDWARNFLTQAASGSESGAIGAGAKHRWQSLDALRALLVEITNVVNNLTTTVPGKVLDARQGKVLNDAIQAIIAKYGVANGLATLGADGKVPASQIPSLALVDVFTVADETAMLALDAEQGDMAIRSDTSQVFVLSASPASTLENWIELSALKALVDSALDAIKGDGYTSGTLKSHEDRLDTLEGTGEGSVAKAIDDAVSPLAEVVDNNRLYSDSQYLALKAKADSLQVKCNTLQAEVYTDAPILQYGAVEIIGDGYEADGTSIDVSANVVDGSLDLEQKGLTITNLVKNGDFSLDSNSDGKPDYWSLVDATCAIVSKIVSVTGTAGTSTQFFQYNVANVKEGDVFYFQSRARVRNANATSLNFILEFATGALVTAKSIITPTQDLWYDMSVRVVIPAGRSGAMLINIRTYYAYATGNVTEIDGNYGVSAYNLTALGLSAITDTAILAKLLPYVDGTKAVGKMGIQILDADDNVTQTIFLPEVGNSLPNGVADSIKTVADGWEHSKRVSTPSSVGSGVAVNTTNYPTAKNAGQWVNELTAGGTEIGVIGTDSTTGAGMLRFELATPIVTKYDLPHLTSGKTIHRFAGEEKIALYGTGLTFSENVLSVLTAIKFVAGVMTDITSLATITTNTVTFSGVNATDVVYVKVEHDVDKPLGVLEHTPAVSNTASRLAAIEAWIALQS